MPWSLQAAVLANAPIASGIYRLRLAVPADLATKAKAGQFVMIRTGDRHDPLLRRPFSIHDADRTSWSILYRLAGQGTAWLSRQSPGQNLAVIGPLGRGFPLDTPSPPLLVGGGIGVAPLPMLARQFSERHGAPPEVIIGFRTADEVVAEEAFLRLGCNLTVVTEDGSRGAQGLVTDVLPTAPSEPPFLMLCGPWPMMRAVARIARERGWQGVASLETTMACGIGACLGCAVPANDPHRTYLHVCQHGPVLELQAVQWENR